MFEDLTQESYVGDGQSEGVDFGEAFLVGERRHVLTKLLESGVDAGRAEKQAHNYSIAIKGILIDILVA